MYSMFSTPLTCCSIGAATVSATTCALAPGYEHVTCTVGGAISGYCAIGSTRSATNPAMVSTIERTEEKIGRSIKNRANIFGLHGLGLGLAGGLGGGLLGLTREDRLFLRL